jgi:hypothetical protein
VKEDRQWWADGRHSERCCHEPVDAVLGPLDDYEKSGNLNGQHRGRVAVPPAMLLVGPPLSDFLIARRGMTTGTVAGPLSSAVFSE